MELLSQEAFAGRNYMSYNFVLLQNLTHIAWE
jgi:hypothetical protein